MPNTLFPTQHSSASIALFIENYTSSSSNTASQKIILSLFQVMVPTLYLYIMCNKKVLLSARAMSLTTHQKVLAIQQSFYKTYLTLFGAKT
jgi:hypothetical protein